MTTTTTLVSPDGTQRFSFTPVETHDDRSLTSIYANTGSNFVPKIVQRSTAVNYYRALIKGGWIRES